MKTRVLTALACVLTLVFGSVLYAGESGPVMNGKITIKGKKSECPKECQLRAKAAMALEATKQVPKTLPSVVAPAPVPHEKINTKSCSCGPDCKCPPGICPDCEATIKVGPAVTSPTTTYFQRGNVIYECSGGICRAVGTVSNK